MMMMMMIYFTNIPHDLWTIHSNDLQNSISNAEPDFGCSHCEETGLLVLSQKTILLAS
jgi:hypothetical protein